LELRLDGLRGDNLTIPSRETTFLANNARLYRIVDAGEKTTDRQSIKCDNPVADGYTDNDPNNRINEVTYLAFPHGTAGLTRRVPVVAVFQAVISY